MIKIWCVDKETGERTIVNKSILNQLYQVERQCRFVIFYLYSNFNIYPCLLLSNLSAPLVQCFPLGFWQIEM